MLERNFWVCLALSAPAMTIAASGAMADENGKATYASFKCADNAVSSITTVCKSVKKVLPFVTCPTTSATCVKAKQEIFTGLTGEPATPANIKSWNGQGGGGVLFQDVGVCLLRGLSSTPMHAHAKASLPIGEISSDGLVGFTKFDPKARTFEGYQRLRAHAPVIGDVDILTQPFSVKPLDSDLTGKNLKVGEYALFGVQALEFSTEGGAESFSFDLKAIKVVTPYGVVSPQPHVTFGRGSVWSLSPYGGAAKMLLNPGGIKTTDVYGRLAGQSVASSLVAAKVKPGKYPGSPYCSNFGPSVGCLAPEPMGWDSQLVLGSRNVDPSDPAWTAPSGVEYPARPDANAAKARGAAEKIPNGYASAGVKVEYSPTDLIPQSLLGSYITASVDVFVDPNIAVSYASQFDFWNAQGAAWVPSLAKAPPGPVVTPVDVESIQSMALISGASVAGRFALDAGVDITLHLHIPLPWPFDDIDFNIVDVHPRSAFLEKKDAANQTSQQKAAAVADWQNFLKTGKMFSLFSPLDGGAVDGLAYIQACLSDPAPPESKPDEPIYEPGDGNDLVDVIDMPCNICIGVPDYVYNSVKYDPTQKPLHFKTEKKTLKGWAVKAKPVDDSNIAPGDRWTCAGEVVPPPTNITHVDSSTTPGVIKNLGCYDECRLNKQTGTFSVIASAKQLYAQGILKDTPNGCY